MRCTARDGSSRVVKNHPLIAFDARVAPAPSANDRLRAGSQRRAPGAVSTSTTSSTSTSTSVSASTGAKQAVAPSYVTPAARKALFQPAKEQPTEVEAQVSGSIPSWLSGSLLINGGGDYSGMLHMFDGYAMVNKLRIQDGKVFFSHRYLGTKAWKAFEGTGRMRFREFATPLPAATLLDTVKNVVASLVALMTKSDESFTDNASVNLVPVAGGQLLALSESMPSSYLVQPSDLSTGGQVKYTDGVPGDLTTAHPKVLPDGTLINFSRSLPFGGFHVYRQDPSTLARTQLAFIRDRDPLAPAWVHDFALSERFAVICETPLYFNMPSLVLGTPTKHIFMDWKPQDGTRVHLVPLDGSGAVRTFTAPPFFAFHFANAHESDDGRQLHADMGVYDDPAIVNDLYLDRLAAFPGADVSKSYLRRLTIPLAPGAPQQLAAPAPLLADEAACGSFCEFPAINPRHKRKAYRYAYTLAAQRPTNMGNALAKSDLQQRSSKLWHEPGCAPGEPAFVPAPGAAAEDEGVVLDLVMGADGRSFLLVLDAASFTELGRAQLPLGLPYRFHGAFMHQQA